MSQMCRSPKGGRNRSGGTNHASVNEATEDVERIIHSNNEKQRSRRTNKIPKTIRYELENSLISLCNVWFEDIKPHLVRNNIKLHMHNNEPEAGAPCSSGSGDNEMAHLPGSPFQCSHVDPGAAPHVVEPRWNQLTVGSSMNGPARPGKYYHLTERNSRHSIPTAVFCSRPRRRGANYAGSSSTLLIASKAPSPKPPLHDYPQRRAPHLELSPTLRHHKDVQNLHQTYNAMEDQRPYTIAVHINKNLKKPPPPDAGERLRRPSNMVRSGEDSRVPRYCNTNIQVLRNQTLPDDDDMHELFISTCKKAAAVGLYLEETCCLEKHITHRFQKVIHNNLPRINEQRKLS